MRSTDRSREITLTTNMTPYAPEGTDTPIDVALNQFVLLAFCGAASGAASSPGTRPAAPRINAPAGTL